MAITSHHFIRFNNIVLKYFTVFVWNNCNSPDNWNYAIEQKMGFTRRNIVGQRLGTAGDRPSTARSYTNIYDTWRCLYGITHLITETTPYNRKGGCKRRNIGAYCWWSPIHCSGAMYSFVPTTPLLCETQPIYIIKMVCYGVVFLWMSITIYIYVVMEQ